MRARAGAAAQETAIVAQAYSYSCTQVSVALTYFAVFAVLTAIARVSLAAIAVEVKSVTVVLATRVPVGHRDPRGINTMGGGGLARAPRRDPPKLHPHRGVCRIHDEGIARDRTGKGDRHIGHRRRRQRRRGLLIAELKDEGAGIEPRHPARLQPARPRLIPLHLDVTPLGIEGDGGIDPVNGIRTIGRQETVAHATVHFAEVEASLRRTGSGREGRGAGGGPRGALDNGAIPRANGEAGTHRGGPVQAGEDLRPTQGQPTGAPKRAAVVVLPLPRTAGRRPPRIAHLRQHLEARIGRVILEQHALPGPNIARGEVRGDAAHGFLDGPGP